VSVQIYRQSSRKFSGLSQYSVSFSSGRPFNFLIQTAPRPQSREWQILFARELAATLLAWADFHENEMERRELDVRNHRATRSSQG
jgi:hypothetical protein